MKAKYNITSVYPIINRLKFVKFIKDNSFLDLAVARNFVDEIIDTSGTKEIIFDVLTKDKSIRFIDDFTMFNCKVNSLELKSDDWIKIQ